MSRPNTLLRIKGPPIRSKGRDLLAQMSYDLCHMTNLLNSDIVHVMFNYTLVKVYN